MILPDFLTRHPYGEIRITGHRIDLYTVMRLHQEGLSAERIAEELPTLSVEQVQKVLAFARANREEVEAYVEACRAEIERQESLPPGPGLLKIRAFLEMIRQANEERKGDSEWERLSVVEKLAILQPDAIRKDGVENATVVPAG